MIIVVAGVIWPILRVPLMCSLVSLVADVDNYVMELLPVLLLTLLTVQATPLTNQRFLQQMPQNQCASMIIKKVNNMYYVKDSPTNLTGIPADIRVHWKTGKVFFTLISDEMKMRLQAIDQNGRIDTIKITGTGQSTTVDNRNDIVYLAADNGVYKYIDDTPKLYTASGEDVMYVAVSNDGSTMFIATWPQNRVHMITKDGQKQETFSLIPDGHDLTVDTRNNIYFVASKTSYILRGGHTIPIKIKGLPTDRMTGVFVSKADKVYGMDETGNLYLIDPDNAKASFVGAFDVQGVNSFALDAFDNVLIGVKGAILRYNRMEASPCPEYVA